MNILSLSYGKDSLACIEACKQLDIPIDHIVHAQVWFDKGISGDLPEMEEFKDYADVIIKNRYGLTVERISSNYTYTGMVLGRHKNGTLWGFPSRMVNWCNYRLKLAAINKIKSTYKEATDIIGIAADETKRIEKKHKINPETILPLEIINWKEIDCYNWCKENMLLSPLYSNSSRRRMLVLL